jgi:hypothetical protein
LLFKVASFSTVYFHRDKKLLHLKASGEDHDVEIGFDTVRANDTSLVKCFDPIGCQFDIRKVQAIEVVRIENSSFASLMTNQLAFRLR